MNKLLLGASLLAVSLGAGAQEASAEKTTLGVSVDASVLLGAGLSVGIGFADKFSARIMHHAYTHEEEQKDDGGNYDGEFDLSSTGAMFDYHPFGGVFRITAGFMANGNKINLKGTDNGQGEYKVGDCTYISSTADPLFITGDIDFNSSAPYLGFGWGGNMNAEPGFYGIFDIGVMFSGSPKAKLDAGGSARAKTGSAASCGAQTDTPVSTFPQFQDELDKAEREANEEGKEYKFWPNISFGIGWRF